MADALFSPTTDRPNVAPGRLPPTDDGRMRFSRDDYHRMIEAGVLTDADAVELLDGEIIAMLPFGPKHVSITDKLTLFFVPKLTGRFICRNQGSHGLSAGSEPEPDFQILRYVDDFYAGGHPTPKDVVLLIEVADTSLRRDRGSKLRLYAQAGIVEYWIADLSHREMIVHRDPDKDAGRYRNVQQFDANSKVTPQAIPDCELDLAWLFH